MKVWGFSPSIMKIETGSDIKPLKHAAWTASKPDVGSIDRFQEDHGSLVRSWAPKQRSQFNHTKLRARMSGKKHKCENDLKNFLL